MAARRVIDPECIAMDLIRKAADRVREDVAKALIGLTPEQDRRVRAWALDRFPRLIEDDTPRTQEGQPQ